MNTANASEFERVFGELLQYGLLLESDPMLPSVCSLITSEPLRGSWWSHPLAHTIFQVNGQLADHGDVLITKLISSKVTFIHRRLWSEVLAVGRAREAWQMTGLSAGARRVLKLVDQQGSLRTDKLIFSKSFKPGEAARELEKRLLLHSDELHTQSGAHAKLLETWQRWADRISFQPQQISSTDARVLLEETMKRLNEQFGGRALLPWQVVRKNIRQ